MTTTDDMREANDKQGWRRMPVTSRGSRCHVSSLIYLFLFKFTFFLRYNEGTTTGAWDYVSRFRAPSMFSFIFLSSFSLMPIIYRHDSDVFCDQQNGPRDFVNQCFIYLDFNNEIGPTQPQYYSIQLRIGHNASAREQRRGRWAVFRYYQDDIPLMTSKGPEGEQGRKGSW